MVGIQKMSESMIIYFFKLIFISKYIKIVFFLFFKIIFKINVSKQFKIYIKIIF